MKTLVVACTLLALLTTAGSGLAAIEKVGELEALTEESADATMAYAGALSADIQAKASAVVALVTFLTANVAGSGNAAVALVAAVASDAGATPELPDPAATAAWAAQASGDCFEAEYEATRAYLAAKASPSLAAALPPVGPTCDGRTIAETAADAIASRGADEAADLMAYLELVLPPL